MTGLITIYFLRFSSRRMPFQANGLIQFLLAFFTITLTINSFSETLTDPEITTGEYSSVSFELGDYVSIKDHPKSQGVNFRLRPPKRWLIYEGEVGGNVYRFWDKQGTVVVGVGDMPTFRTRANYREYYSDDSKISAVAEDLLPCTSGKLIDFGLVTIGRHPAIKLEYACNSEINGTYIDSFSIHWVILYEDKTVSLMGMGVNKVEFQELKKLYNEIARTALFD